jgi:pilus assembly protein Flp/PilA
MNNLRAVVASSAARVAQPLRYGGDGRGIAPRFIQQLRRGPQIAPQMCGAISSGEELMSMLINYVKAFANQEEGQDLLEYALLVALIALIAIGAVGMAGGAVNTIFTNIANALSNAA